MATNEEIDVKVLEAIRSGKTRASAIQVHIGTGVVGNRDVDRSLQRLRKKKQAVYTSPKGWKAVS